MAEFVLHSPMNSYKFTNFFYQSEMTINTTLIAEDSFHCSFNKKNVYWRDSYNTILILLNCCECIQIVCINQNKTRIYEKQPILFDLITWLILFFVCWSWDENGKTSLLFGVKHFANFYSKQTIDSNSISMCTHTREHAYLHEK